MKCLSINTYFGFNSFYSDQKVLLKYLGIVSKRFLNISWVYKNRHVNKLIESGLYTLDILAQILRHCDNKILWHLKIFSVRFRLTNQGKLLKTVTYCMLHFVRSLLGCSLKPMTQNYQYLFYIFIAILCIRPKKEMIPF
jgi:hypothetical protein